jgi:hypothetical protein
MTRRRSPGCSCGELAMCGLTITIRKGRNNSPTAVPQIEQQVSHEPDVTVLYVYGRTEPSDVLCHIVAEDDRSHGRFACSRATHQQHFALLLALATLRRTHGDYRRPECVAAQREYMYVLYMLSARLSRSPGSSTASKHRRSQLHSVMEASWR